MNLAGLVALYQQWLYLPDPTPLYAVLGTVVGNCLAGDPVWLLLVGPPSCGKTELLGALDRLTDVHPVSTLTEAGLLTGTQSRNAHGTGGLLRAIGQSGIIVCKDFTSLLSDHPDSRSRVFAALREIYDGRWTRHLGTGGGQSIEWQGRVGLLAAVTETIDRHLTTMGTMGERFLLHRMPQPDRRAQGRAAFANVGREQQMRDELAVATAQFVEQLNLANPVPDIDEETREQLVDLVDLVTRARSPVERDARNHDVELVPTPEAIGRMLRELTQLRRALILIGLDDDAATWVTTRTALDSIPALRRRALTYLMANPGQRPTARNVADAIGYSTGAVGRTLEDLAAHQLVIRHSVDGGLHHWQLTELAMTVGFEPASNCNGMAR